MITHLKNIIKNNNYTTIIFHLVSGYKAEANIQEHSIDLSRNNLISIKTTGKEIIFSPKDIITVEIEQ